MKEERAGGKLRIEQYNWYTLRRVDVNAKV